MTKRSNCARIKLSHTLRPKCVGLLQRLTLKAALGILLFSGQCTRLLAAPTPQAFAHFSTPNNAEVIGMQAQFGGVSIRLKDVGWVRHGIDNPSFGLLREGGLNANSHQFIELPRVGHAVITDDHIVQIRAFVGQVLWEQSVGSEVVAFGVVGNVLEPDGSSIFFADQKTLSIRETLLGAERIRLEPSGGLSAADMTRDSSTVVTAGPQSLTVWDPATGEVIKEIEISSAVDSPINFLKILLSGDQVVLSDSQSRVEVWNLVSGEQTLDYKLPTRLVSIDLSSDGQTILLGGNDGTIKAIRTSDGDQFFDVQPDSGDLVEARFDRSQAPSLPLSVWGRLRDGRILRWKTDSDTVLDEIDGTQQPFWPDRLSLSNEGNRALIHDAFLDQQFVYDLEQATSHPLPAGEANFLSAGEVAVWSDRELAVWNFGAVPPAQRWTRTFEQSITPDLLTDRIEVSLTNDEGDTVIRSYSSNTGDLVEERPTTRRVALGEGVTALTIDQSRVVRMRVIAEQSTEEQIDQTLVAELVVRDTGVVERELAGEFAQRKTKQTGPFGVGEQFVGPTVWALDSWDGQLVAIGTGETLRVWEMETGRLVETIKRSDAFLNRLAFSEDSQLLGIQFIDNETFVRHNTIYRRESEGLQPLFDIDLDGLVNFRFIEDSIEFEHDSEGAGRQLSTYDLDSGERLSEEPTLDSPVTVFMRDEPFRVQLKILEEEESEHFVTRELRADLLPNRSGNRWLRSLDGTLTVRLGKMVTGDTTSLTISPHGYGTWIETPSLYIIAAGDAVGVWNYKTGQQVFTWSLDSPLPHDENTIGYRVRADRVLADNGRSLRTSTPESLLGQNERLLLVVDEQVYDPEADGQTGTGRRFFAVLDLKALEVSILTSEVSRATVYFDSELRRALVSRSDPTPGFDLWEVTTSSRIASLPNSVQSTGGTLGIYAGTVRMAAPTFSPDGRLAAIVTQSGVSFWDVSQLPPGLAMRREGERVFLIWDDTLVDTNWRLQTRSVVDNGTWTDVERGDSNRLEIESREQPQRYFRWTR